MRGWDAWSRIVWLARPSHLNAPAIRWDGVASQTRLRATQILEVNSFKRAGNRTKRSGHFNLSHRQDIRIERRNNGN